MPSLLHASESLLLVVDVHERLARAVANAREVVANNRVLLRAAGLLGVRALVSEHCPPSLGPTLPDVLEFCPPGVTVAKTHFSCAAEPAVVERVAASGARQIVVTGMEAHVCVLQSAIGFRARGYEVFVVRDAAGSRTAASHAAGLERLAASGVTIVTTEMVVFEWLGRADRPEFKPLLALIK